MGVGFNKLDREAVNAPDIGEKNVALGPLPPRRQETGLRQRDDGVGLTSSIATPTSSTWRVAVGPLPPADGRRVDATGLRRRDDGVPSCRLYPRGHWWLVRIALISRSGSGSSSSVISSHSPLRYGSSVIFIETPA